MNRTIIIHPDNRETVTDWPKGRPGLKWLQEAVGGYIETVPFWNTVVDEDKVRPCIVFANEDGKRQGAVYNEYATELWAESIARHRRTKERPQMLDHLVGDIVIVIGTRYFRG